MTEPRRYPRLKLQVFLDSTHWLGPGKADLLEQIAETGSISAAGRTMGMSYKRAWMLVETLNTMFPTPLVDSARGGAHGGGALLTPLGHQVLGHYRAAEDAAARAAAPHLATLADMSDQK